jgi:AraC-like DNA-binding protein
MVVPLTWFLDWKLPAAFNRRIVGGNTLLLDEKQTEIRIPAFSAWAGDFTKSTELHVAIRLEVEAFFRRLAISRLNTMANEMSTVSREHPLHHIERIISTITKRFREPLSIQDIADSANLNPEYAMRLFRDRWGMTLLNFLQQQRIAEARRLLLLNDLLVIDVAFACGFQSLGRFYHVFKQQCGMSPGAYRRNYTANKGRSKNSPACPTHIVSQR